MHRYENLVLELNPHTYFFNNINIRYERCIHSSRLSCFKLACIINSISTPRVEILTLRSSSMNIIHIFSVGVAIFAMLFGSGNIVYPLALGRASGDAVFYAMIGFFLTAVFLPIIGLVSTLLCNGEYKKLFHKLGLIPGNIIVLLCMMLIGPFAIIPRCVTIAYASIQWYIPACSLELFSAFTAFIIFLATYRPNNVVTILSRFLGPIKLTLLCSIIILGLRSWIPLTPSDLQPLTSISMGLVEGFWTLDLLGTVFFSGLILQSLRKNLTLNSPKELALAGLQAGTVGSLLLGTIYAGFCLIAAMHSEAIAQVEEAQLLTALSSYLLGNKLGAIANFAVAVSCITTAIVLTTVFADYLQKELLQKKIPYIGALFITVIIMMIMANFGFAKIMSFIAPPVFCIYPALVVLALTNILQVLWGWRFIKTPFWLTLVATVWLKYF